MSVSIQTRRLHGLLSQVSKAVSVFCDRHVKPCRVTYIYTHNADGTTTLFDKDSDLAGIHMDYTGFGYGYIYV